jgi:hypothetical protein
MFMKLSTYVMAPAPMSAAYAINSSHQCICLCVYRSHYDKAMAQLSVSFLSVLGRGSVNTFLWKRVSETVEDFFDASFSVRFMFYQRTVCGSPYRFWVSSSVKTFHGNEELLEASFSGWSVPYQRKVGNSFFPKFLVFYKSFVSVVQ